MTELANLIQGGAGVTGAFNKESQVGTQASGTITEVSLVQLNDYVTKQPKFWDDGKPQMQIRIVFQADQSTWFPTSEDDTGLRSMHIKTWGMHLRTFREAMQAAGAAEPQVGGHLSIRFAREEPSTQGSPTKVFEYQYRPPASDVSQMLGGQQQQAQAPQQPYQQPQQQQPQQFQAPQPQQAPVQQQPVAPVAPAQAPMVATPQGQVDPATGELSNFPAPVPAQQPQQQAQQPAQQAQAPQQAQQQPVQDPWTGQPQQQAPQPAQPQQPASQQVDPNAGMDSQIIKLVRGGIPDNVITQTLGVTAEQVAQIRATLG